MPSKRSTGCHSTVIRCPNCGEDYSITYKRCPFCNEKSSSGGSRSGRASEGTDSARKSGRRVANGSRDSGWSPLRIAGTVVSLAVIASAAWIVMTQIVPLVQRSNLEDPPASLSPAVTQSADVSASPDVTQDPLVTPSAEPSPSAQTPASPAAATGFSISHSDVTLTSAGDSFRLAVTIEPADASGTVTFSSDKPEVASVDENGAVTAKSKGTANITASLPGSDTQTCIVRCNLDGSSGGSSSAVLSLNRTDFTFTSLKDPSVQMKVTGTSSAPSWSIGNTSVATISSSGVVKPVGRGTTTVTCKVDGQTLECIVRCSF